MVKLGDFTVPAAALEYATEQYGERSDEAKAADKRQRAPVTTDAQEYGRRPGELDFPGVDTPREAPPLLPKDQMRQGADLSLSARASSTLPANVMGLSRDAEVRDQELAERGVPASKDEVDNAVGAVGMTAIGGFDKSSEGEKDPLYAGTGPLSDREMNTVTRDEQRIGELAMDDDPYDGQPMPFGDGDDVGMDMLGDMDSGVAETLDDLDQTAGGRY
jgi:hypothetical protein